MGCDYMDRPRDEVREVLNHLENSGKVRQRTCLCTNRGVAAWLLISFQRLWIILCPEGPRALSLQLISDLASQVVAGLRTTFSLRAPARTQLLPALAAYFWPRPHVIFGRESLTLLYPYSPARAESLPYPPWCVPHILIFGFGSVPWQPLAPTPNCRPIITPLPTFPAWSQMSPFPAASRSGIFGHSGTAAEERYTFGILSCAQCI